MSFQRFEYRDLSQPAKVPGDQAQSYAEPNFEHGKDARVVDSAHRRPGHFQL